MIPPSLDRFVKFLGPVTVLVLIQGCRAPDADSPSQYVDQKVAEHAGGTRTSPPERAAADPSAEDVFRRFLTGLALSDEAAIRDTMVVHEGMEILWKGAANREMAEALKTAPLRRARVGEALQVPSLNGPRTLNVTANEVNDSRVLLLLAQDPIPHAVVKVDGRWRADGGEFIAARLAALRAHEKRKPATPADGLHL